MSVVLNLLYKEWVERHMQQQSAKGHKYCMCLETHSECSKLAQHECTWWFNWFIICVIHYLCDCVFFAGRRKGTTINSSRHHFLITSPVKKHFTCRCLLKGECRGIIWAICYSYLDSKALARVLIGHYQEHYCAFCIVWELVYTIQKTSEWKPIFRLLRLSADCMYNYGLRTLHGSFRAYM